MCSSGELKPPPGRTRIIGDGKEQSMKKRTRVFLFAAAGVLVVAFATGLVAWATRLSAAVGGASEELAYVPATARMVAYVDVRGLTNSPFRDRLRQLQRTGPAGQVGLEAQTGIRFDKDVDAVLIASTTVDVAIERVQGSLLVARGRFDATRIEELIRGRGGRVDQYRGKRLVTLADGTNDAAVAFAEPGLLIYGPQASVRGALDAKAGAATAIASKLDFMTLVNDVSEGTAWSVAKIDTGSGGSPLPSALSSQLPPIDWLAASGRVDSGLHGFVRAEARDVQSAESLRDVVQGFLALAKLQGGRDPAYRSMLDSVALSAVGKSVSLTFDVTPAALELLTPSVPPTLGPQAPRRP
jgi:hypothetical protein